MNLPVRVSEELKRDTTVCTLVVEPSLAGVICDTVLNKQLWFIRTEQQSNRTKN